MHQLATLRASTNLYFVIPQLARSRPNLMLVQLGQGLSELFITANHIYQPTDQNRHIQRNIIYLKVILIIIFC